MGIPALGSMTVYMAVAKVFRCEDSCRLQRRWCHHGWPPAGRWGSRWLISESLRLFSAPWWRRCHPSRTSPDSWEWNELRNQSHILAVNISSSRWIYLGLRSASNPPTPPPNPRLSFSAGGAQPSAPSNIQTSTYTKGALKHLTVVFDFLGLKHPPGSPGGWWQVIRLNHSDNKAIWNLIQQELVDKSQHFEALDAPHQLDLLPLRDW